VKHQTSYKMRRWAVFGFIVVSSL